MGIFWEIVITLSIASVIIAVIYFIYGKLLTPVSAGSGGRLYTVLETSGSGTELQQTVDGLRWLIDSGRLNTRIIIVDRGLNDEGKKTAQLLARDKEDISVFGAYEFAELFAGNRLF